MSHCVWLYYTFQQDYLWRAVDAKGNVLDVRRQRQRDPKAAECFVRKLLKKQGFVPQTSVIARLKSDAATNQRVIIGNG